MAGRDGKKQARSANVGRRMLVGMGAGAGVFFAAAAMATGSAAPAKADFEDLLDPIIQPILTSLTDSIGAFDPAAAVDLTSWTDSFLASLNSIDLAAPAASEPAAAVAAAASPAADPTSGTYDIPITLQENTEPTVQAAINGGSDQTLLVDTGSSGLVIPYTDLGSNFFTQLESLYALGFPTGISESGYSGGVQYIYLEYNDATVNYGDGVLTTTNTPIDVEVLSWSDSDAAGAPANFQDFLTDNDSTGILGIGDSTSDGGPTVSPLQAAGYDGVTVDIPTSQLIVDPNNPFSAIDTLSGAPTPTSTLTEVVSDKGTTVGTATVSDDIDSGGVYGTIPSTLVGASGTVPNGDTITVYDGTKELYTYTVENNGVNAGYNESPSELSSGDTDIDSGFPAFEQHPIYIDYADNTLSFDN
jgi:hypothetical protein